jgi:hypothetical protein
LSLCLLTTTNQPPLFSASNSQYSLVSGIVELLIALIRVRGLCCWP